MQSNKENLLVKKVVGKIVSTTFFVFSIIIFNFAIGYVPIEGRLVLTP
jgi:hypothetical protein